MRKSCEPLTFALIAIFAWASHTSSQAAQPGTNTEAQMKALISRYYACWNNGAVNALDEILSRNYVRHEEGIGTEPIAGREAVKENILVLRTAYSDLKVSITDIVISGNRVVTVWNLKGTQTGAMGNLAPTGKKVNVSGVLISNTSNGKIVEEWSYFNQLKLFAQLGYTMMPPEQNVVTSAEKKGEVLINGITLSKRQLAEVEQTYGVQPQPGSYWYDTNSGLYGVVGYAAFGFMFTGHNFGKIDRSASNGNTGVIVNGRELPQSEWAVWSQVLGYWIQPGSYWFDENGNAGYEGSPVALVNLYVAAQQNAYGGRGGGDNFWSTRFSAGNYDSGNQRGYVSVPGYGPVGYGF